jgi:acyl-CoA dehydrogenase
MDFELSDEHRMLADLVKDFVRDYLLPLEAQILAREAAGKEAQLTKEERANIDRRAQELGLCRMDVPVDLGGSDMPAVALVAVNAALGYSITPYVFPPDSPNLRMLDATVSDEQRQRYLLPYVSGKAVSAIAISEPGAGADPSAMQTRAVRDGEHWVLNGRKIWISKADYADFSIVMAVTGKTSDKRNGISAFIVEQGTPGMEVARTIPMIGGHTTYEVVFEDCRIPSSALLGREGGGFEPMQLRLSTRRLEIASCCIGVAERALEMLVSHAKQRKTFGQLLCDRQVIQWWIADACAKINATKLMAYEISWKIDRRKDVRALISMIKVFATEMATEIVDHAIQAHGAMGVTKEMPLHLLAAQVRLMRIYDGPSEIHRWVVARDAIRKAT